MQTQSQRWYPRTTIAAALLMVAACADQPVTAPQSDALLETQTAFSTAASESGSPRHPNSLKYSDEGIRPATGRAGSATLEVRALRGKDGSTTIEASTGSLEAGTTAGDIVKAQLKVRDHAGNNLETKNFNGLSGGGHWSFSTPLPPVDGDVQVQVNVRGKDPKRTGVVTLSSPVALRPDLTVLNVTGPTDALPNVPAAVVATVAEVNGDVGARADCVLTVDGVAVDQASGIWVDAGGTVACQFMHAFDEGTYQVGVTAASVNPGDWDLANNSAVTTITVAAPGTPIESGSLQAVEAKFNTTSWWERTGNSPSAHESSYDYDYSIVLLNGYGSQPLSLPLQEVRGRVEIDGVLFHSRTITTPTESYGYSDEWFSYGCWNYVDGGVIVSACSAWYADYPESNNSSFQYALISGEVIYSGTNYSCNQDGTVCDTYTWNSHDVYGDGTSFPIGSEVRAAAWFVEADGTVRSADATVQVEDAWDLVNYEDEYCYEFSGYTDCYGSKASGSASIGLTIWP